MIKETCSCGAQVEINFGSASSGREQSAIDAWRREHRHEAKTTYLPPSYPQPYPTPTWGSGTTGSWKHGEHYVLNNEGEPVWIGDTYEPKAFVEWATAFKQGWDLVGQSSPNRD